jgi:MFS family permease
MANRRHKGLFIAHADVSLVMATYGTISSHFDELESASWLTTSYAMAMCATQPVIGKMCDIFGRKAVLLSCYAIFAIGSLVCGIGQSMPQIIAGRAITGVGGAGMGAIVSILITDLVPILEVASWRSYVNVVATLGRSIGGPLGGWLCDTIGWRWSFIGQAPVTAVAFLLVLWRLETPTKKPDNGVSSRLKQPSKLGRVDFVGSILISTTITALLFAVDLAGRDISWTSPLLLGLIVIFLVLGSSFIIYEANYAREPIFPPRLLLQRDVATSYLINVLQGAAQLGMMFSVPLYFQVVEGASNTRAGSHLIPAVVGNAVGSLLVGIYIKKTGLYKNITLFGVGSGILCYTLLIIRWHGNINPWESLEVIPGGFGTGVMMAATFIALTANISHENMAVATSGMYLAGHFGVVIGVSTSTSAQKAALLKLLTERLRGPGSNEVSLEHEVSL